ncbi:MAG TPA: TatD family hydrolase [Candidatus Polarisedimenticolia bacterium]|nr:TatD family hydrolase [Candidatus Polarisedimenticolia bacterium]
MYADSHAHLSMPQFETDLHEVIHRAREAGVLAIMTCGTSLSDARRNLNVARAHHDDGVLASAGFHPHQAGEWGETSEATLRDLIREAPEIAAIGEVGLDFHYNFSPADVQIEVLRRQIALARAEGLPLIVHCRNAREQMRRLFVEEKARETGGVLHCFSEDAEFARFCLDQGFYVSFSGIITFKKADAIREAARIVPLDRLLIETDSPYLAPVPHRGRRNEPALVAQVARFIATLHGLSEETIAAATTENFHRVFGRRGITAKAGSESPTGRT